MCITEAKPRHRPVSRSVRDEVLVHPRELFVRRGPLDAVRPSNVHVYRLVDTPGPTDRRVHDLGLRGPAQRLSLELCVGDLFVHASSIVSAKATVASQAPLVPTLIVIATATIITDPVSHNAGLCIACPAVIALREIEMVCTVSGAGDRPWASSQTSLPAASLGLAESPRAAAAAEDVHAAAARQTFLSSLLRASSSFSSSGAASRTTDLDKANAGRRMGEDAYAVRSGSDPSTACISSDARRTCRAWSSQPPNECDAAKACGKKHLMLRRRRGGCNASPVLLCVDAAWVREKGGVMPVHRPV